MMMVFNHDQIKTVITTTGYLNCRILTQRMENTGLIMRLGCSGINSRQYSVVIEEVGAKIKSISIRKKYHIYKIILRQCHRFRKQDWVFPICGTYYLNELSPSSNTQHNILFCITLWPWNSLRKWKSYIHSRFLIMGVFKAPLVDNGATEWAIL